MVKPTPFMCQHAPHCGFPPNRSDDGAENFSDFYAYHINTNTWNKLYVDIAHPTAANPDIQSVKSRINHSMLYDDVSKAGMTCIHLISSLFSADQQKDLHFRGTAWKRNLRRLSEVRRQRQHHHLCSNIMQRAGCLGTVNLFGTFARIDRSIERRGVCTIAGQFVDFLIGNK